MSELGKSILFFSHCFFEFRLVNTLKTRTSSFFRFDMGISRFILDSDFVINNNCIFIFFINKIIKCVLFYFSLHNTSRGLHNMITYYMLKK